MKFISLNIAIKINNTQQVIDYLTAEDADIILLQEALRPLDKEALPPYRSVEIIIEHFKDSHPYSFFAPLYQMREITKNGKTDFDFGGLVEQGILLLSRFPIDDPQNIFYYNEYRNHYDATNFKTDDWVRSLLVATIQIAHQELKIIGVHGIWNASRMGDERTLNQSRVILNQLTYQQPTIIAGDFNLFPQSESIALLNKYLHNVGNDYELETTRPLDAEHPERAHMIVDYIFCNENIMINNFDCPDTKISDHLPLILKFDLYE